jgi:site-specific DNA-methyltransferase (adenine-specific)/adenine-specific DNA-methyltransferase
MKEEYPILQWKDKKKPEPIQYFPAQLKEQYGEGKDGWMNKIFWGDNIQVIGHLLKEYRGKIDLIYIDPPFDSKKNYKKKIKLKGKKNNNDINTFEEKQYSDTWTGDDYLQFMYERLIVLRELLSETGSIYLHCDPHKSHYLKVIMDSIFGQENFLNDISWCYSEREASTRFYNWKHDCILFYQKSSSSKRIFNYKDITLEYSEGSIKKYNFEDERGRKFQIRGSGGHLIGKQGLSLEDESKYPKWTYRDYLDTKIGVLARDYITDIRFENRASKTRTGYPTQKPEKLIEKFIIASSNKGDIVFDCFMGSGTTQAVAMKLGRKFIGADINLGAIQTTTKRLINIANNKKEDDGNYYGFEVYNVNKHNPDKSEAEACVVVENNKLKINDFFSMKLSQKMNIEKGKEDWRRFVEFIVIDLNYDGNVIKPSIIDIPSKNELVKGEYDIPSDVGKIKIKITDISLETFEFEITNIFLLNGIKKK